MAQVVFLRGVNVGGHRTFRPSSLAGQLAHLDVVNVGAAGTFVVRRSVSQAVLRAEVLRRLPFQAEIMICRSGDVIALASAASFPAHGTDPGVSKFVSVLARRPRVLPSLPIRHPARDPWGVKVVGIDGRFVLSFHRRLAGTAVYPNEVVEKHFGVPATTRNWSTISAIRVILEGGAAG